MIKGHNRMSQRQEFDAHRPDAEDFDTTDAARRAARQAGMSLSSWMSQVVSDKAAKLGIYEDDMDEDERMDAIVEKLTRLNLRNGRSMARMQDSNSARDSAAHAAAPRRALGRAAVPELGRVLERLESMESRLAAQMPDSELVLQNALERIEQRIDQLDAGALRSPPAKVVSPARADTSINAFATIEAKLEALNASLDRSSNLQSNRHSEPAFTATRRFEAPRKAPASAVTPSFENTSAHRFAEHETKAFDGLHAEIAKLAAQMHELRRPQPVAEIANLQQDLANMAKALADLAPRQAIASLEHRIDDLIDSMRHNNSEALHNGLLGPINDLTSELRQMVSETDPRAHISTLEQEVRHLSRKVSDMETAGFDHVAFADLQGQTAEMRQLLQKTLARPQSFEALERQIAFLTDKREHMSAPGASHSSAAEIAAAIDDIRTMVDRKLGANPLGAVERQIAFLTDKIDHLGTRQTGEPAVSGNSDEIVAAIDEVRSLLNTKPGSQHIQALENQLHALSSRIDMALAQEPPVAVVAPVAKLDMSALESMLNALAAKIDDARQPSADTHAFAALEAQMNRISAQFDSAETSSMHFRSLQNSITDLFAHLEQTREVALRAAETAVAHTDARSSQMEEQTLPQVNALSQDINSLLQAQEAAERRATQTMTAVHATLERIVGRLASLEEEVTDTRRRPEPSTFAPVSAPISSPIFAKAPQNAAAPQQKTAPDAALQGAIAAAMAEASAPQDVELIEPSSSRLNAQILRDPAPDFSANREDWGTEEAAPEDFLLEPGKGFSPARKGQRQDAGLRHDQDEIKAPSAAPEDGPTTKSDFIAAARRAAQAAAVASQNQIEDAKLKPNKISSKISDIGTPASLVEKARRYAEDRKRPLLLGLAGVMVAFLGVQVYGAFGGDAEPLAQKAPQIAPAKPLASVTEPAPAPVAAPVEVKPVQPPAVVAPVAPPPQQIAPPVQQGASGTRPAPPLPSAVPPSVRQGNPLGLPPGPKAAIQAQKSLFSLNLNPPVATGGFGQSAPVPATRGFSTVKAPAITAAAKKIDMMPLGATAPQPEAVLPADTVPPPSAALPPAPKLDAPAQQVGQPAQDLNPPKAVDPASSGTAAAATAVAAPVKLPNPPVTVPALTGQTPPLDAAYQPASSGLKAAANAGNPAAQFELASKFADGRGETRDFKAASALFEKAAAQNLAPAQYRLGALYEKGLGVPRDLSMAKALYQKAADQGNPRAMHNLAVLTAEGSDGHPDYAGALNWFKKAAEYGVRDSQFNLGILCARGLGQAADLPQAYLWFAVAASQGDEDAAKKRDEGALRLDALALETAKANFTAFKAKTAEPSAVEVQIPQGGWDATAPKVENRKLPAPVSKAKIS